MDGSGRSGRRFVSTATGRLAVAVFSVVVLGNVDAIAHTSSRSGPSSTAQAMQRAATIERRTLDGSGNNQAHPLRGRANRPYIRVGAPFYADGVASMVNGPSARLISNRIFNDIGQNIFSENNVTQWGWTWGQFLDHDIGLRDETAAESAPIPFDAKDPLESFTNDFGVLQFDRTPAAPNTGVSSPRQQINTISSYIDGSNVYGVTADRLEWLRKGPVDGNLDNNRARLMLPNDFLPRVDERGDASKAPPVDLMGRLQGEPTKARVAGDVRANENIALTATHTLFAREHNRIVALLPRVLTQEQKFNIARRIVGAEIQFITYNEFLPAMGVNLPDYKGYDPNVNAGLGTEFATVGYRAHSMVHGQFDVAFKDGDFTAEQLDALKKAGVAVADEEGAKALAIPLNVAFGNPDLLEEVGMGRFLKSLSAERQYRNDEQIDNSMRSVLFKVPKPGAPDPAACQAPVVDPNCFTGVVDLGALDVQRDRDHGIPSYNELRKAFGLAPQTSFTGITGEDTDAFPAGLDPKNPSNDPKSLEFTELRDADGKPVESDGKGGPETVTSATRRSTTAARLKAVYGGDINKVDAFTGMVAEKHVDGTEFGELQLAMWTKQFTALRDGDRFFYANDRALPLIERVFGITFKHTLSEIIQMNTDATDVPADVFKIAEGQ